MATSFAGYHGLWEFDDWEFEALSIKQLPETGHTSTTLATNVPAKADREKQGMALDDMGARPAYNRTFYFAATYRNTAGNQLSVGDFLEHANVLVDDQSNEWGIESVSNPGGADEHYEVITVRRPRES
jgi:hypothetical protein